MQTQQKITGSEFDSMVDRGAFADFGPRVVELIDGELRLMNPAGPIHDDHTQYVLNWSYRSTESNEFSIRCQSGIAADEDRPEPDVVWLTARRYGSRRPQGNDVQLLIEVSDSSVAYDLQTKSPLYAARGVREYWVVDIPNRRIHCFNDSDGTNYRSITLHAPPAKVSPQCKPDAVLDLTDLFEID